MTQGGCTILYTATGDQAVMDANELAAYRRTGMKPEQISEMLKSLDDDYAPRPLIMRMIPTPEQFWGEE